MRRPNSGNELPRISVTESRLCCPGLKGSFDLLHTRWTKGTASLNEQNVRGWRGQPAQRTSYYRLRFGCSRFARGKFHVLFDDPSANIDAFVANKSVRSRNQFADGLLRLVAERTAQNLLPFGFHESLGDSVQGSS
jgi:hypothetical protein